MATKKKTAKTEDVAVELKLVEESVEQKDVQAVDKAVDAVEELAPARSVQDHVTVVIPYCKEFAPVSYTHLPVIILMIFTEGYLICIFSNTSVVMSFFKFAI